MKRNLSLFVILFSLTITTGLKGQKIVLESGDLSVLKNEKSLNFEFTYDKMAIGELPTEADYIDKKVKEHNSKEPGKGDKWQIEWNDNKSLLYEPSFITNFNKSLKKYQVVGNENEPGAKYTVLVTTNFIEIGFTGWSYANKPSEVNLTLTVYEGNNRASELARVVITGAKSTAGDYSYTSGVRISSAYATAGKLIGKYFAGNVYK